MNIMHCIIIVLSFLCLLGLNIQASEVLVNSLNGWGYNVQQTNQAYTAMPEAGQKGFLYNFGSGQFITADVTYSENKSFTTTGQIPGEDDNNMPNPAKKR